MTAVFKTILFLGVAIIVLGILPAASAENDDFQTPQVATLVARPGVVFRNACGTLRSGILQRNAVVGMLCLVSFHYTAERVSSLVFQDGRSDLRSPCMLRC